MQAKIQELESKIEVITANNTVTFDTELVESEAELEDLARKGYECQIIAPGKWLMKRRVI